MPLLPEERARLRLGDELWLIGQGSTWCLCEQHERGTGWAAAGAGLYVIRVECDSSLLREWHSFNGSALGRIWYKHSASLHRGVEVGAHVRLVLRSRNSAGRVLWELCPVPNSGIKEGSPGQEKDSPP